MLTRLLADLLVATVTAALMSLLLAAGLRRMRFGTGLLAFFLVLLLATWAAGLWMTPLGPPVLGVSWLSYLIGAAIIGLLLSALPLPPRPPRVPWPAGPPALDLRSPRARRASTAFDIVYWVLCLLLVLAVALAYLRRAGRI